MMLPLLYWRYLWWREDHPPLLQSYPEHFRYTKFIIGWASFYNLFSGTAYFCLSLLNTTLSPRGPTYWLLVYFVYTLGVFSGLWLWMTHGFFPNTRSLMPLTFIPSLPFSLQGTRITHILPLFSVLALCPLVTSLCFWALC